MVLSLFLEFLVISIMFFLPWMILSLHPALGGSIPPSFSLDSGGLRDRHQVVSGFTALDGSIPPSFPCAVGGSIPPPSSLHSESLRERHPVSSRYSALDGSIPPSSPSALGGSIPPSSSLHSGGLYERHIGSSCSNASDGSIPPSSSSPSWRSLFVTDRPISRSSSLQARGSVSMGPHTLAVSSVSPSSPCVLMPHPLPVSRPSFTSFLRMGVGLVHSAQSSQSSSGFRSLAATSSLVNDSIFAFTFHVYLSFWF